MVAAGKRPALLVCWLLLGAPFAASLNDYWNKFCGKANCYELLYLSEDASPSDIKRAYRAESLKWHPDKNPSPGANARFQQISKAYQVLSDEEQRSKYDYYRENPAEYWVEYGNYFYTSYAPKSDVRLVLFVIVFIISIFVPIVQYQKYQSVCTFLKRAAIKGLGLHEGGTKETLEVRKRALELRDQYREKQKANGESSKDKKAKKKMKDEEDPDFLRAVNEVVDSMEIKGSYRKPNWNDVLAYQLVLLPYTLWKTIQFQGRWYYVHSIQKQPLSEEEERYLAIRTVGTATWEAATPAQQAEMLQAKVWEGDNFELYKQVKLAEELKKRPGLAKKIARYKKRQAMGGEDSDDGM